jgi:hypothetical protein
LVVLGLQFCSASKLLLLAWPCIFPCFRVSFSVFKEKKNTSKVLIGITLNKQLVNFIRVFFFPQRTNFGSLTSYIIYICFWISLMYLLLFASFISFESNFSFSFFLLVFKDRCLTQWYLSLSYVLIKTSKTIDCS